jgi:hypothetical protein
MELRASSKENHVPALLEKIRNMAYELSNGGQPFFFLAMFALLKYTGMGSISSAHSFPGHSEKEQNRSFSWQTGILFPARKILEQIKLCVKK